MEISDITHNHYSIHVDDGEKPSDDNLVGIVTESDLLPVVLSQLTQTSGSCYYGQRITQEQAKKYQDRRIRFFKLRNN